MKKEFIINNGKYKILKKIGSGRFSTCWEAEVLMQEGGSSNESLNESPETVAVKIQRNKRDYLEMAEDEIKYYKLLDNTCENVLQLKDYFTEQGGDICMVFEKMDKTLLHLIEESKKGLPLEQVKDIIKQILKGIDYLHKNGIVHTDLKPENILVKENSDGSLKVCISDLGNACLFKDIQRRYKLGKQNIIERYEELREDHKIIRLKELLSKDANEVSIGARKGDNIIDPDTNEVSNGKSESILTVKERQEIQRLEKHKDVREFRRLDKTDEVKEFKELEIKVMDSIGTTEYNSVEAIIGADYGYPTDIWSVACVMFECLTNDYLFDPHSFCDNSSDTDSNDDSDSDVDMSDNDSDSDSDSDSDYDSESDDEENRILIDQMHLWLMTRTLGEIPKYVSRRGDFAEDFFNKAGNIKRMPQFLKEKSISYILNYDYDFDLEDAKKVEEFMLPMLTYDAEKRISAEKALESEFLRDN